MSSTSTTVVSHARTRAPRSSAYRTRALLVVLAIGALLATGTTVLVTGPARVAASPPGLAAERATTQSRSPAEQAVSRAAPGSCLTWTLADAADITAVDCASPHLFEVAADVDLGGYPGGQYGPDAPFPGAPRLAGLRTELCTPAVTSYLRQRFDPYGAYSVGLINPGEAGWAAGGRTLRCGLQKVGRSGAPSAVTGTVAGSDQSDVTPVGTCMGIAATVPTDPVDCARPHAAEAVALVDLAPQFPAGVPSTADQDAYLNTTCAAASDRFLGATDAAASKGLTVFWADVRGVSWAAGSKRVNCYVGRQQAGGGFAPITGDARNSPAVGATPAPSATSPPSSPTGPPTATPTTTGAAQAPSRAPVTTTTTTGG